MRTASIVLATIATTGFVAASASADGWVSFVNETSTRLVAAPGLGAADPEEKDFAYADFNQDGFIDLIVVRKQPFTNPNGKRNVLLMNEGGILVDRTIEFATLADDGGQGFLDITNDRDVAVGDFNGDGWLDFVTCPALNQGQPKTISHPRVYMNQGMVNGVWGGFKYEQGRIPQLPVAPNGCGIAVGDVTGNGFPDIYIVTYLESQGDRLLINNGNGFFTDQTSSRMTPTMIASGFGTAAGIVDMNGDGVNDVIKSENGPFKATYNNPANQGFFNKHETPSGGAHYGMSFGDLNNDGKIDVVLGDDGADRYLLNVGNGADGMADFESKTFSFLSGGDDGFGNNVRIVDLNNDGFRDVLIADVDVDIGGCSRRLHLYRNLGNVPSVTLQDQGTGGIPEADLVGTHDVAVFDINNDGWPDMVVGRCVGLRVFMQVPPSGLVASFPEGLPAFITPGAPTSFLVSLAAFGGGDVVPGSGKLNYRKPGGPVQSAPLVNQGNGTHLATLPPIACTNELEWWLSAQLSPSNGTFTDPPSAPASTYRSIAAFGTEISLRDEFEAPKSEWTVLNAPSLTGGAWELAIPNGTAVAGSLAAPDADATAGDGVRCWVTQNGVPGGSAGAADVDGGPTWLSSPLFDLAGADAIISFAAWFFCDDFGTGQADSLLVEVSNNGGTSWTGVMNILGTGGAWKNHSFKVSQFVDPTAEVRVRFSTSDIGNNSITEAGIDNFQIERVLCSPPPACAADLSGDGAVDAADLAILLGAWGSGGAADLNGDGVVDAADLASLLGAWGPC